MADGPLIQRIIIFGVTFLMMLSIMGYQLYKMKSHNALINRKLRFGIVTSALIMGFPFILFFSTMGFGPEIKELFGIDNTKVAVITFFLMFILAMITSKIIYAPIDREKYLTDLRMKQANYQGWRYYLLDHPAETLRKSLSTPSWGKRTPTQAEFLDWHEKTKDNPPGWIQLFIFFITFILTTCGLTIIGYLINNHFLSIINLIVIPFILFSMLLSAPIFWLIRLTETLVSKILFDQTFKYSEPLRFLLFNLGYVLVVSLIFSLLFKLRG